MDALDPRQIYCARPGTEGDPQPGTAEAQPPHGRPGADAQGGHENPDDLKGEERALGDEKADPQCRAGPGRNQLHVLGWRGHLLHAVNGDHRTQILARAGYQAGASPWSGWTMGLPTPAD